MSATERSIPNRSAAASVAARIADEAAVQQCFYVTGETDYILVVTATDMDDYQAICKRLFEGDENIRRYSTSIALERIKTGLQLPLTAP